MKFLHRVADILRSQSSSDDDRTESVRAIDLMPVKDLPRSWRVTIQKKSAAAVIAQNVDAEVGMDAKRLDHFHPLDHRAVIGRFVAVELDRVQAKRKREVFQVLWIGMIHEHTDDRDERRQVFD